MRKKIYVKRKRTNRATKKVQKKNAKYLANFREFRFDMFIEEQRSLKKFSSEIYILMAIERATTIIMPNAAINFDWNTKIIENITIATNKLTKWKTSCWNTTRAYLSLFVGWMMSVSGEQRTHETWTGKSKYARWMRASASQHTTNFTFCVCVCAEYFLFHWNSKVACTSMCVHEMIMIFCLIIFQHLGSSCSIAFALTNEIKKAEVPNRNTNKKRTREMEMDRIRNKRKIHANTGSTRQIKNCRRIISLNVVFSPIQGLTRKKGT